MLMGESWMDPYGTIHWMKKGGERFVCGKCEWMWVWPVLPPQRALLRDILAHRGMKLSVSWQGLERQLPHTPILDMIHARIHTITHTIIFISWHVVLWWVTEINMPSHYASMYHSLPCLTLSCSLLSQSGTLNQTINSASGSMWRRRDWIPIPLLVAIVFIRGIGRRANCSLQ